VYGFTKMILKLMEEKKPEYLVVAFDPKGPTFRHRIYEAYKANRPPMPEDLAIQIPFIRSIMQGLSVPIMEKDGFEADDIIGTLARLGEEKGFKVVIVTGDKDFKQLLSPQVVLWDTMKDRLTDYDTFMEESGIHPSQVIDLMGLSGDSTDNIPGVLGVGEKTATDLIRQFGSLEGVFDRLAEVQRKKLRENLEKSRSEALLSRELATIDRFVPLDREVEDLRVGLPDGRGLSGLFSELEFRGLWEQFSPRESGVAHDYRLCFSEEDLSRLVEEIRQKGEVSIDTETTSEDPWIAQLVGISFSLEEGKGTYLPLAHVYPGAPTQLDREKALHMLKGVLEDSAVSKVGQNIKYDALVLKAHGVKLAGIRFDTMIASYVINPGLRQHNLDFLAQHFLRHKTITYEDVVGKGKNRRNFSEVEVDRALEYSCEDADITLRLMGVLQNQLREDGNEDLFHNLEMALVPVLIGMETWGIRIDPAFFEEMSRDFSQQMMEMEKEIYAEAGMTFNIQSPQQLGYVLFEKLGLPSQKKTTKTKAHSTDVKVLTKLSALPYRLPKLLLRYRTLSKLKSTYLDALVRAADPRTGRIHTSFNQTVTATGRLSSSNPNLQNVPVRGEEGREIRKGFIADKGCRLLSADYSQVELRIFAHYSGDQAFLNAFQSEEDIHTRTASEILGVERTAVTPDMRRIAKAINFGIIYGMGPQKLADELGIDQGTARKYISAYYDRYKGVARYREEIIAFAREKGYVTTLFNRRRYLPDINHKNRIIRGEAERMAINTPIQGTAADLIKKAMIQIHHRLRGEGLETRMILQVHDELVFEVPEREMDAVAAMVRREMEGVFRLRVPLKVDVKAGRNWDEAH